MTDAPSPIGEPVLRREDPRLLRGEGQFVGDLKRPRLLHAAFVLCPHGHARIARLSLDRARAMPGVVAVVSAAVLPVLAQPLPPLAQLPGVNLRMPSPLARDIVRCAGEAVAVVVAEDRYVAADAADAVEVEYEPLPVVLDQARAVERDSPLVHEDVPGNIAMDLTRGFGNVAEAFGGADVVVRERFQVERAAGAAIEPRGVMAEPGGENGVALTVWVSTQAPHALRRTLAQVLELSPDRVRVITPDVGGGFGPKGRVYPEQVILAALALHLGRPVSWQATRREDMLTTYQGRGLIVEAEIAARSDGTLLGLRAHLLQDCGAYMPTGAIPPQSSAQHMIGPYRLPAYSARIVGVFTNKVPLTPLRGGGRELGVYVMERMMDHLARRLGMEPHEVRRINALRSDEFPFDTHYPSRAGGTVVYDSGDYPGHLERALDLIGYDGIKRAQPEERSRGVYRGVAVTLFIESTGLDKESARVEVDEDGNVLLTVGSPSNGQSHATTLAQVCAARLGVPVERISYVSGDTQRMSEGTGTFGSRTAVLAGNAAALAALEVREKALRAGGEMLEITPGDLEIVDGTVRVRGMPDRAIPLGNVARHLGGDLQSTHTFAPDKPTTYSGGAHAAVVEVDIETGEIHVQRYAVVHDCGAILNPTVVEGQIHGGVAHGLGNALGEMMQYDLKGRIQTGSFHSYVMPLAQWMPRIEVEHRESPSPYNPEGIKGAGEGGTIGALATIARAVEDALEPLKLKLNDLPLRPEKIAEACTAVSRRRRA